MADLKFHIPVTEEVEVDRETSAAIDRSIKEADQGRTVSVEEAREMIPSWISKLESGGTLIRPHHGPNDPPRSINGWPIGATNRNRSCGELPQMSFWTRCADAKRPLPKI